ncbi:MAG: hypothetical protein Q8P16_02315, partial [bacterium]|nr:hypothetical protein [bacterium]
MRVSAVSLTHKPRAMLIAGVLIGMLLLAGFALPKRAEAFPWGGAVQQVIFCWNDVIWASVGAPRGGQYIWVPGVTRTYNYGPPRHSGQWLLGLAAPPYFCIVSPWPI